MKIPVVLLDRDVKYSQLDGVFIDNENGAFNAVKLLFRKRASQYCHDFWPFKYGAGAWKRRRLPQCI